MVRIVFPLYVQELHALVLLILREVNLPQAEEGNRLNRLAMVLNLFLVGIIQ